MKIVERFIVIKDNKIIKKYHTADGIEGVNKALENQNITLYDNILKVPEDNDYKIKSDIREYDNHKLIPKPNLEKYQKAEFNFETQEWDISTSYKNEIIYDKNNYEETDICKTDEIPEGYTIKKPIENYPNKWNNDNWIIDIDEYRKIKYREIRGEFDNDIEHGSFFSEVLQIPVSCRRGGMNNDKQNVEGLIRIMEDNNIQEMDYVGDGEYTTANVSQLKELIKEMEYYVFDLYHKRWNIKAVLNTLTTVEEIDAIIWNDEEEEESESESL